MSAFNIFPQLYCLCIAVLSVTCRNCVKVDSCSCRFNDGSNTIIDLHSLASTNTSNPLIYNEPDPAGDYEYSYNPCYGFVEGTCSNAAACQISKPPSLYYNIGDVSKVFFNYVDGNLEVSYSSRDDIRSSTVRFICDPLADSPNVVVYGEIEPRKYSFEVTSLHACPRGGNLTTPIPSTPVPGQHVYVTATVNVTVTSALTLSVLGGLLLMVCGGVALLRSRKSTVWRRYPQLPAYSELQYHDDDGIKTTVYCDDDI